MMTKKTPHAGITASVAAAALGKLGGSARMNSLTAAERTRLGRKGGLARSAKLSAAERSQIATKAVRARERRRREERKRHGQA